MEITSLSQLDFSKSYSYADYFSWKIQERVELIRGKIFAMSPAPASRHQRISNIISSKITVFLENSPCEVFVAPFDVRLHKKNDDKLETSVVQPDICVICDSDKIDERGCNGTPDLVVEILSPGNSKKEMGIKFDLYEEAGVLEYWIADPTEKVVFQYVAVNGKFVNYRPLLEDDILHSKVLEGFSLDLSLVFADNKYIKK